MNRCPHCGRCVAGDETSGELQARLGDLEQVVRTLDLRVTPDGWLELRDVARLLGRDARTIRRWLDEGSPEGRAELVPRKFGGRIQIELRSIAALLASSG